MQIEDAVARAKKVADETLAPAAAKNDKEGRFSTEAVTALGSAGLLGLVVPKDAGGAGLGPRAFSRVTAQLAEADASVAMVYMMHVAATMCLVTGAKTPAAKAVLAEIGAGKVPELVVINKIDAADPVALKALLLRERGAVLVSAKTGEGLAELREAIEEALPERDRAVRVSVPYSRGDLVARAHAAGEVTRVEHGPDGTLLEARVPPELAAELERFPVA